MANLKWREDSEGFASGNYRIRRVAHRPRDLWRLEIVDLPPYRRDRGASGSTLHATLRSAKATARTEDADRLTRNLVAGHTIIGIAAFVLFAGLLPIIGNLATFALAAFAFFVGLRSLTFAVSIRLADVWGWNRDDTAAERLGLADRAILGAIAWFHRRSPGSADGSRHSAVRVLPPESPK